MVRHFSHNSSDRRRKGSHSYLAFSWVSGLILGILAYLSAGRSGLTLMRSVPYAPVSIVGALCVSLFPVLISAYAVFLSNYFLLLPVCFAKAFLFSFVSSGIFHAFAGAGWLMRIMLLFTDWTSLPILYWFWLRSLSRNPSRHLWEAIPACSLIGFLGCIQFRVISPFLVRLIEF